MNSIFQGAAAAVYLQISGHFQTFSLITLTRNTHCKKEFFGCGTHLSQYCPLHFLDIAFQGAAAVSLHDPGQIQSLGLSVLTRYLHPE